MCAAHNSVNRNSTIHQSFIFLSFINLRTMLFQEKTEEKLILWQFKCLVLTTLFFKVLISIYSFKFVCSLTLWPSSLKRHWRKNESWRAKTLMCAMLTTLIKWQLLNKLNWNFFFGTAHLTNIWTLNT